MNAKPVFKGLILAGGLARRFNEQDKGLLELQGRQLISWVIERLCSQVELVLISANRNLESYRSYRFPVLPDELTDYQGPLAGLSTALGHIEREWLQISPCDTPLLPYDMVDRLYEAAVNADADIALPSDGDKAHYLHMLLRPGLKNEVDMYLAAGKRSVKGWLETRNVVEVDFSDQPDAFMNINSQADLVKVKKILSDN